MHSSEASQEINRTLLATQQDHDNRHFEQWFAAEQQLYNWTFKQEEAAMKRAWSAALSLARAVCNTSFTDNQSHETP
jgi:hypothetical protein